MKSVLAAAPNDNLSHHALYNTTPLQRWCLLWWPHWCSLHSVCGSVSVI